MASRVLLSLAAGVGAVGVPVNAGDAASAATNLACSAARSPLSSTSWPALSAMYWPIMAATNEAWRQTVFSSFDLAVPAEKPASRAASTW
ncbi:hypothetical protein AXXA_19169 [Achromobacter insuavis AXX-A]|uniref:Secreted protein n=1 Tax=Achromobacter insuavis AXX-A TaxID=1003200 RepID=F7T4G3_9BURK|nr:hypothetical protein AXXA_19169 [Achromobacter insuavis AXX-A]